MAPQPAQVYVLAIAWLSLLSLFWFTNAGAQYRFDIWTTDNGLPQNPSPQSYKPATGGRFERSQDKVWPRVSRVVTVI